MFSISPFSTTPFSSLGITSINATSLIEAIATVESVASLSLGAVSSIDGVAVLTADGTLTIGGASAQLSGVIDILANATVRGESANIFIWTVPERDTTWTIPVDVGATTWIIPS
jgi:FtsP/CotA-like multicopper oxidase with cupredoxin domain